MTDDAPKKTADELLQDCANNTAAMLALCPSIRIPAPTSGETPEEVEVVSCCARELEWVALRVTLRRMPSRHVRDPRPVNPDTWVEQALGVLTLISTQRYYIAAQDEAERIPDADRGAPEDTTRRSRSVYPVATDKPVRVPYELRFRNIDNAWSHRASPTSARSSAPTRSARPMRARRSRP